MAKPWLKLWVEWIHDPKILRLTLAERGAWSLLLTLAQQCDADGYLVLSDGSPMSVDDIVGCLHITQKNDVSAFHSMVHKMTEYGSLSMNPASLFIVNFSERQAKSASETKEAIRDRVHRYRERQRHNNPPLNNPPLIEKDIDIYIDKDTEEECNGEKLVTSSPLAASNVTETPLQEGKKPTEKSKKRESFDIFWKVYPRKKSKGQAEKAFFKIGPGEQLLETMLTTIERAKKSGDWLKEDGRFIPYPATWLNARGWEDEYPEGSAREKEKSSAEKKERGDNNGTGGERQQGRGLPPHQRAAGPGAWKAIVSGPDDGGEG